MIYLKTRNPQNGLTNDGLYFCWGDVWRELFNPDKAKQEALIEFKLHGKNYNERRENLRQIAIDFSAACEGGFSWNEEIKVITWFEKNAARYGLVREFKENGLI